MFLCCCCLDLPGIKIFRKSLNFSLFCSSKYLKMFYLHFIFSFSDPRANMDPVSLPTNATVIMDTEAETVQCRVPLADGAPPVDTRVPVTMGPRVTQ